jgi:hypothetical protein
MKSRTSVMAICLAFTAFAVRPVESAPWSALFRAAKKAETAVDATRAGGKAHAALVAGRVADRTYKATTTSENRGNADLPTGSTTAVSQGDGLSRMYGVAGVAMLLMAAYLFLTGRQSRR